MIFQHNACKFDASIMMPIHAHSQFSTAVDKVIGQLSLIKLVERYCVMSFVKKTLSTEKGEYPLEFCFMFHLRKIWRVLIITV